MFNCILIIKTANVVSYMKTLLQDVREFEPVDTLQPLDIVEDEELERLSGLLQRDNLVRGLGIVEHVYRLLHCTPGTVGIVRPEHRPGQPNHTLVSLLKSAPEFDLLLLLSRVLSFVNCFRCVYFL